MNRPLDPPILWDEVWNAAHRAGMAAGTAKVPTPMVVQAHKDVFDDKSPVIEEWRAPQGVCGFAWIVVRPGNCSFARWCRKNKNTSKAYRGGEHLSVQMFGQSMERKQAYGAAFANVLESHGITAYMMSRID